MPRLTNQPSGISRAMRAAMPTRSSGRISAMIDFLQPERARRGARRRRRCGRSPAGCPRAERHARVCTIVSFGGHRHDRDCSSGRSRDASGCPSGRPPTRRSAPHRRAAGYSSRQLRPLIVRAFHGRRPASCPRRSACRTPGCPAPAARIRSARVPCGTISNSSLPAANWRPATLSARTKLHISLRTVPTPAVRRSARHPGRRRSRPGSSLLRPAQPIPPSAFPACRWQNPASRMTEPSSMPANAAATSGTNLSIMRSFFLGTLGRFDPPIGARNRARGNAAEHDRAAKAPGAFEKPRCAPAGSTGGRAVNHPPGRRLRPPPLLPAGGGAG